MSWPRKGARFGTRAEGHGKRRHVWICRACGHWHREQVKQCERSHCRSGELFYCASSKEARRAAQLLLEESEGLIERLEFQKSFPLHAVCQRTGRPVNARVSYRPDAVYYRGGELVVEDVKGRSEAGDDPVFKLKRRLFEAAYGVQVTILRNV